MKKLLLLLTISLLSLSGLVYGQITIPVTNLANFKVAIATLKLARFVTGIVI